MYALLKRHLMHFKVLGILLSLMLLAGCEQKITGILNPKGIVTYEERILLFDALALMLIVVLPVIIMSFAFVHRYRASHKTAEYKPNWNHSVFLEAIWWGVPCLIIVILGVLSWKYTHKLDPYNPINGRKVDMQIQVISLPWKWLFIYPEQNIATVNYLRLPKDKQVEFLLTNDNVPMSAFFIPQLGSQIYTMAGMRTKLHLIGNYVGTFRGLNSQYNGDGFSEMHFPVDVVSDDEMNAWYAKVKSSPEALTKDRYAVVRQPTIAEPAHYYSSVEPDLFRTVINSYLKPTPSTEGEKKHHSNA